MMPDGRYGKACRHRTAWSLPLPDSGVDMSNLARSLFLVGILTAAGCSDPATDFECNPPCPGGTHCTADGCISDNPDQPVDLAMPPQPDIAGACPQPCA